MKTLSLGFSSCPNDTFIFDALIHQKIDTHGLTFDVIIEDVETLNQMALAGQIDLVKVSFHAYLHLQKTYELLNAGSALGHGCGPLLIARHPLDPGLVPDNRIGIPGRWTTANLLLQLFAGRPMQARPFVFSQIEDALLRNEIDLGVIIHESRFSYAAKGLHCIKDLGEYWEQKFHLPIPLGCIVARRGLEQDTISTFDKLLKESVQFALMHPQSSKHFVQANAQSLQPEVIQKHIDLYVTTFTVNLGAEGKLAVNRLRSEFDQLNSLPLDKN